MVAHFLEASVMFQDKEVLMIYGILFVALSIMCAATFYSALKTKVE